MAHVGYSCVHWEILPFCENLRRTHRRQTLLVFVSEKESVDRDRVGEHDFGSMSANQPEDFEMSRFFLFNILERQGCDFEFEWEY